MKMYLTILLLGILTIAQGWEYIKWRKGVISLQSFLKKFSIVLVLLIVLPLPWEWKVGGILPTALAFVVIAEAAKRRSVDV